ncbi:hypothetical protein DFS33DRAFT_1451965 [Desarmillaria ectypa]|nr:hypothetical protein DFS33DRAFT_1451965 [Desarmillaria ectypa]
MANIIRSAKSGNDWTTNKFYAFNITVVTEGLATFFRQSQLVRTHSAPTASSVEDFASYLLDLLGYGEPIYRTSATIQSPSSSQTRLRRFMRITGIAGWQDSRLYRSKHLAGFTLRGTVPTFYKIPVTADLLHSITTAQFSPQKIVVHKLIPPVPNIAKLSENGMRPLENRRIILQYHEAFKQFA